MMRGSSDRGCPLFDLRQIANHHQSLHTVAMTKTQLQDQNGIQRILLYANDILFIAPILLIPLVFTNFNTNTIVIKETIFHLSAIALVLAFSLFLAVKREPPAHPGIPTAILATLMSLLVYFSISSFLFTQHPQSQYEFSRWFTYILFALLSMQYAQRQQSLSTFLFWTLFVSGIVSLYAIVQTFGFDFFEWPLFEWEAKNQRRVCASLGNPDFLAGYLIALIPVTSILVIMKKGIWRALLILLLLLQVAAMIFSYSRGGWVSLYLTFMILLSSFMYINWVYDPAIIQWKFNVKNVCLSLGLYLLTGLVVLILWWDKIQAAMFRLAKFGEGASVATRPMFYKGALSMWMDAPIFGKGLGMFAHHFQHYRPKELTKYLSFKDFAVDHTHNEFLEILSETGLVGLLLYATLLILVTRFVWKTMLRIRTQESLILLGLWCGLFGILFHNLFTVTLRHTPTAFLFWLYLGVLVGYATSLQPIAPSPKTLLHGLLLCLLPLALLYLFPATIRHYQGDRYIREGYENLRPVLAAKEIMEERQIPYTPQILIQPNRAYLTQALLALHKGQVLSPYREKAYYWQGLAYHLSFDYPQGIAAYKKLDRLHTNFVSTQYNIATMFLKQTSFITQTAQNGLPESAPIFDYLGAQCVHETIAWIKQALDDDPTLPLYYRVLGRCFYFLGELDKAEIYYRQGIEYAKDRTDDESIISMHDMNYYLSLIAEIKKQAKPRP
jgi:putative inorganic carbon (hco3(-)) transporter